MKKYIVLLALATLLLTFPGCNDNSTDSSSEFSNSLILGTGMSGFTITGQATSFSDSTVIYWRLESEDDMAGSEVQIQISKAGSVIYTFPYSNPQSYGHIMLSGFYHTFGKGSFRATGRLVTGSKTVATCDYTVQ
ncbi:MAG: hypothetical protein WCU00_04005 [Candidatus Latescibacterota bacterium]